MPVGQQTYQFKRFPTEKQACKFAENIYPKDKTPRYRVERNRTIQSFLPLVPNENDKVHIYSIEQVGEDYTVLYAVITNVPKKDIRFWR